MAFERQMHFHGVGRRNQKGKKKVCVWFYLTNQLMLTFILLSISRRRKKWWRHSYDRYLVESEGYSCGS